MIGIWNIGHRMCVCGRGEGEGNEVAVPNYVGSREAYEGIGKSRLSGVVVFVTVRSLVEVV